MVFFKIVIVNLKLKNYCWYFFKIVIVDIQKNIVGIFLIVIVDFFKIVIADIHFTACRAAFPPACSSSWS